ncbi:hypothetical protein GLOIN_2v1880783 [Rhizophagus irregularis DAOM 181602=DAOM 197198]|uniref:Uncharacterized protein n=2 Tax=Rhizophagus irregularis (strain DAOM 181602 / DAOM 197198 / MUCL 43194) TaxID=747089 RepID=A0A2P4PIC6_RHIID|nr:hypothetical protein GLOIN_2v1880783 [Rhizophagus irregularis DAOM 181602=DAOM 197198]POG65141.1 hypothetical protein GLOIN_2v1880783 [Rhizophagus irregularis DAOM 181602=DAOM 197198]|eukprot:XP_025172007.1 hypothetical protein GLOIN_2v1880783 [Rhizophagus irregularis DAOM 181602=DAOM 197198]
MVVELQVVGSSYVGFTLYYRIYTYNFIWKTMKELVHFFGDSVLKTRTHSQPGSTIIFTAVTDSVIFEEHLNLYEFEAFSSGYCLGSANWMIDCGGEKCHHHTSFAFNETVFNNADVIILNDLRDKGGARFETILIEIGNCVFLSQHLSAVGLRGIPFYAVYPMAEESLKYSNICGEWMCTERQQKMADSSLQEKYQEPCFVFAGYPSLRPLISLETEFTELIDECLDIVNIFINSQFVRTVMTENLASNIELVTNLGKDSLIASLNGTLNIHNTKTSYVCGEFNVSKLINELTEQIYGYRIDEFEEDKRSSSYKISSISPKSNDLFE